MSEYSKLSLDKGRWKGLDWFIWFDSMIWKKKRKICVTIHLCWHAYEQVTDCKVTVKVLFS